MRVDRNGDLVLQLAGGELRTRKPLAYQEVDGAKSIVTAGYVIKRRNRVGIHLGAYDPSVALVIDPTAVYSTYLGGNDIDQAFGIAVDNAGAAYVTGLTTSPDFPITAGAFQTTKRGNTNVFVTKFNPAGSGLVYSTFLGGNLGDEGYGIAVDDAGAAYVTGLTTSTTFPVTPGAFQTAIAGIEDAFVTKLNPAGTGLVYSTYLGGSGNDQGSGIAVDAAGNAYVTGLTPSTDFPVTAGAFQTTFAGGTLDAFVTKFNPAGSSLLYSTYLGGSNDDYGHGIAVDAAGNAYVTGHTASTNFPTTPGAFQTTFAPGSYDAFVTKFNPAGSGLSYSTYLGGSASVGQGIAVDAAGAAYVAGHTASTTFPTTPGAFQTTLAGVDDAFVTKFNPAGSSLLYSTYLGGSDDDLGLGIAIDAVGGAYVTGWTRSTTDFPTTAGAFQTTYAGGVFDAFVFALNLGTSAFTLSVSKNGNGTGTVTSSPAGINCGSTCSASFAAGTQVTLTATPASGSTFNGWGGACSGTGTCIVTMNSAQSVSAGFSSGTTNTLSVSELGPGTVTSSPAGINCPGTCSASFASGTQVSLSQSPAGGWNFLQWDGDCSGNTGCSVTMNANHNVMATFWTNGGPSGRSSSPNAPMAPPALPE